MNTHFGYQLQNKKSLRKSLISTAILFFGLSGIAGSLFLYPRIFASSAVVDGEKALSLSDPLLISFSNVMIPQTLEGKFRVFPKTEVKLRWRNNNRELVVYPDKAWKPETQYQISVDGVRNIMLVQKVFSFSFKTIDYPQIENFFPETGSQNVVLDIEDPIRIKFKDSIDDFKIKIAIDPDVDLESRVDLEKNEVMLIPKKELDKGKKYLSSVLIKGSSEDDNAYRNIFNSQFTTKVEVPQVWEKNFALRLEQAKIGTEAKIEEGKYIDINVKNQIMAIFENGQILDTFLISSGKKGMDTPQGSFKIANKFPRAWSKKYGLFMPFWMAIVPSGDFGIHELPEWPGGYKEGTSHLGIPVSHGCVRLGVGSAERVYNWAEVGTPVVVHS